MASFTHSIHNTTNATTDTSNVAPVENQTCHQKCADESQAVLGSPEKAALLNCPIALKIVIGII